jgi:hypothetical protein
VRAEVVVVHFEKVCYGYLYCSEFRSGLMPGSLCLFLSIHGTLDPASVKNISRLNASWLF